MMRKALLLLWMLFPVLVVAFHFNYGASYMARERAYTRLQEIRQLQHQQQPDWLAILGAYELLCSELPADEDPRVLRQIELAICEARIEMLDLQRAIEDLSQLLQETAVAYGENASLTRAVREQLGKAHYYATWVLKTNGAPESEWRPYAERARQLFRYLAELEDPQEFTRYEDRVHEEFQRALQGETDEQQAG